MTANAAARPSFGKTRLVRAVYLVCRVVIVRGMFLTYLVLNPLYIHRLPNTYIFVEDGCMITGNDRDDRQYHHVPIRRNRHANSPRGRPGVSTEAHLMLSRHLLLEVPV